MDALIVDDELNIRKTLGISLENLGCRVAGVGNVAGALEELSRGNFDLAFVDLRLGTESGMGLVPRVLAASPATRVVVITAFASIETAVEAIQLGADDYLPKPFTPAQVRLVVEKALKLRRLDEQLKELRRLPGSEAELSSRSPRMQRVLALARQAAASDASILLRGENGTGKGVLARAIHEWSRRAGRPFTVVSCPALSADLLESELFGHVKGAFTGAVSDFAGRIAACQEGTLFLDEIGDLPPRLQPKLLRFLQDKEYERVGESVIRRADVRLLAATNVDLEKAVATGAFREDLFYRLNVISLELPPLRERAEDILPLAGSFLSFFARLNHRPWLEFSEGARQALQAHAWPGNVRELRNAVERAVILGSGSRVEREHLPDGLAGPSPDRAPEVGDAVSLQALEEAHLRRVLARSRSMDEAASILAIDVATLWRKRKKLGL